MSINSCNTLRGEQYAEEYYRHLYKKALESIVTAFSEVNRKLCQSQ